jgi:hydrogenase maturation protein HypF
LTTFHIHIQGIVQGVGFRPFVYKLALQNNLKGWVNNTTDGVHIQLQETEDKANKFLNDILKHLPPLAVVTKTFIEKIESNEKFSTFEIIESTEQAKTNLLLTPDVALCENCRQELHNPNNRRYHYPFITCTNCGPRYSIVEQLPYDRPFTTMSGFEMCSICQDEYNNPLERRHFSQTNSCSDCRIEMQLYSKGIPNPDIQIPNKLQKTNTQRQINEGGYLINDFKDLSQIIDAWQEGKIIAIKGIGGYLLTCDATNKEVVELLRKRKHRPAKPFALMYPSMGVLKQDVKISNQEELALKSIASPIVLLSTKSRLKTGLALGAINKGLCKIGVMLPYTPLLELLLTGFGKPIVATSGNISHSTIIFQDDKALTELTSIADLILMNNREILLPQDDGVVQFTPRFNQKITLRRSRGKAPIYISKNLKIPTQNILATGSMLKSVFGFVHEQNFYISQYLGNTESYDAQQNYKRTYNHLQGIFNTTFTAVVTDKHPDYFATRFGEKIAKEQGVTHIQIQHHKAHFWSVLGEHNLLENQEPILGVIWDGTGLGDDRHIWGGEFFLYSSGKMKRVEHLEEFSFILGDKMVLEPRISALAIFHYTPGSNQWLKTKFTEIEWNIYQKLLIQTPMKSTSMGRLFDAVSSILFGYDKHSFEAEASMHLENQAYKFQKLNAKIQGSMSYLLSDKLPDNFLNYLIINILSDLNNRINPNEIAYKFHVTLVDYIDLVAKKHKVNSLAFSGGVFQNALLVDLVIEKMQPKYTLYFQEEFSPNDEGIPFGQLVAGTRQLL